MRTRLRLAAVFLLAATVVRPAPALAGEPERVSFLSTDEKTMLVGYLFAPADSAKRPAPAVVMLHGRAGPYSSLAHGVYTAATLTHRHQNWGQLWASRGYFALMVDSFGPRGYPAGFAAGTYGSRPAEINEVTVRPLDAYGGLRYLRSRSDVIPDRIGLQGWSNGGSTVLATMAAGANGGLGGFRAALALYPGCLLQRRFESGYRPYAPVRLFIGTDDEEVSPKICMNFAAKAKALGSDVQLTVYPDATHDFDDPGKKFQRIAANRTAADDARARATAFFAAELER